MPTLSNKKSINQIESLPAVPQDNGCKKSSRSLPNISSTFLNTIFCWSTFSKYSHFFLLGYCFWAAISIAATQILLSSLLVFWLITAFYESASTRNLYKLLIRTYQLEHQLMTPIIWWVLFCILTSLTGIKPTQSLIEVIKTSIFLLLPFCIKSSLSCIPLRNSEYLIRIKSYLGTFILGQSIAGLHSLLADGLELNIPRLLPGAVTESGQLVLIIPCAIAFIMISAKETDAEENKLKFLQWSAFFLLLSVLLVNLKRGPWLGVLVELSILGLLLSRRLLLSIAFSFSAALILLEPARARLFSLFEHFSIAGGRKYMWQLGFELAQRFPLGVGMKNAVYMRELDPNLPERHRHMHNNLLNITVETGWIGLAIYVWWMFVVISLGFELWKKSKANSNQIAKEVGIIALCLSCALLGWQTAGLVEYNFGDGEIRLISLFFMGLLISCKQLVNNPSRYPEIDMERLEKTEVCKQ